MTNLPPGRAGDQKLCALMHLLESCFPLVHFATEHPGVVVPAHLKAKPICALQYGLDGMAKPIRDLRIDADGITATLTFGTLASSTHVPWSAVFAIVDEDGDGWLWRDDLPAQCLIAGAEVGPAPVLGAPAPVAPAPADPRLSAARADGAEVLLDAPPDAGARAVTPWRRRDGARKPSHLKLVD